MTYKKPSVKVPPRVHGFLQGGRLKVIALKKKILKLQFYFEQMRPFMDLEEPLKMIEDMYSMVDKEESNIFDKKDYSYHERAYKDGIFDL